MRLLPAKKTIRGLLPAVMVIVWIFSASAGYADLVIDPVYEAAADLPRVYFLFKRDPNGAALEYEGEFVLNYGFLDTGASGVLMSLETRNAMGIIADPNAQFVDTGVGGDQYFDVSEPIYVGLAGYETPDPYDTDAYELFGPWRMQLTQEPADPLIGEIDLLGIPLMAGKTTVLNSGATNTGLDYFSADVKDANDPTIPKVDFNVALRFEKYIYPSNPANVPPLPVLAYNPVIDNIVADNEGVSSVGDWLLDTGATASLISISQAASLGLTDIWGEPVVTPDFYLTIGGIGGMVEIPGYYIDSLTVPTLAGYNIVYKNAPVAVHDIAVFDEDTGDFTILDGVFGSNFLCLSAKIEMGIPVDLAPTCFDKIIIDTRNALLGFSVFEECPLPCGDANHPAPEADLTGDCKVNFADVAVLGENWLASGCTETNDFCSGADLYADGRVDMLDYAELAAQWLDSTFGYPCGCAENPWPAGDLDRNCVVDLNDMRILTAEWLSSCDWLNWNCRAADFDGSGSVTFTDYSTLTSSGR